MKRYKGFYIQFDIGDDGKPFWIIATTPDQKETVWHIPAKVNSLDRAMEIVLEDISDKIKG